MDVREQFPALPGEDGEALVRAKKQTADATTEIYGRPTLNPTHNSFCQNMFGTHIVKLRDQFPGDKLDYLEVGSYMGASMVTVGNLLTSLDLCGSLTSIDPYFEEGYVEQHPGAAQPGRKMSDTDIMTNARRYYDAAGLTVDLERNPSFDAMLRMIQDGRQFHYIFIDGKHEQLCPMSDLAMAMRLLRPGGVVMLDDVSWPDVTPLVGICERHMTPLPSAFDKATFQVEDPAGLV